MADPYELIGIIEIQAMPSIDFGQLGIASFAQRENGELRQRVGRKLVEQFRPYLAKQQHADGMKGEIGKLSHAWFVLQKGFALLSPGLVKSLSE